MPRRRTRHRVSLPLLRRIFAVGALLIIFSTTLPVEAKDGPRVQEFVVTAYYSPKPNQCCYFRGSYEAEIAFNGEGIRGADGTRVYAGMLAAPPAYPFGTVIDLPGLGRGTVHDRGGRIIEWSGGVHRIDVWVGEGEEGLARALSWGARTVKGTIYGDIGGAQSIAITKLPADRSALNALPKSDAFAALATLRSGEKSSSVRMLQKKLADAGYLQDAATGFYGPATQAAVLDLKEDFGIAGDGQTTGDSAIAYLSAALLHPVKKSDIQSTPMLARGNRGSAVKDAQRTLSHLGYYRGRFDGVFSSRLHAAVLAFQRAEGIVKRADDTGAGRIGPATRRALSVAVSRKRAMQEAKSILMAEDVKRALKENKQIPVRTLAKGDRGTEVANLQRTLAKLGYFSPAKVNGNFGAQTAEAVLKFQLAKKLVAKEGVKGAGVVGPATRQALFDHLLQRELASIRTNGKKI